MAKSIIQVKEQDTVKERERKINDLARLFDDRLKKLETNMTSVLEQLEEIDFESLADQIKNLNLIISTANIFKKGYEDLQVNVSLARLPAVNAPTWRTYNYGIGGGITYPALGFGVNDYSEFFIQTQHSMQLSTILDNHIHWTIPSDSASDRIRFQLDVIYAVPLTDYAAPAESPFDAEHVLVGNEAGRHNILDIANIPGINTGVSTIYICRLTRIGATVPADEYGNEVYVTFDDCHYIRDSHGSKAEYVK